MGEARNEPSGWTNIDRLLSLTKSYAAPTRPWNPERMRLRRNGRDRRRSRRGKPLGARFLGCAETQVHTAFPGPAPEAGFENERKNRQLACKPGSVWPRLPKETERGSHSSGTTLARSLVQPTRMTRLETGWALARPCHPYSVLLPVGFTVPSMSPWPRWALTPPFHPYSVKRSGLLSVALSLGSPPPDVIRHRVSVEPGLSSPRCLSALARRGCPANWQRLINRPSRQAPEKSRFLAFGSASV